MTTNTAEQTYIDILLGRARVKAGAKKPTPTQEYVQTLVDRSVETTQSGLKSRRERLYFEVALASPL